MRKPPLCAPIPFLLLTPLLTIAAAPDIQDGLATCATPRTAPSWPPWRLGRR